MFEKIIGYDAEKAELSMFCDIIKNPAIYKQYNIKIPRGIMLYGSPGVGKTTFAKELMAATERPSFIIRKNGETAEFINYMKDTFEKAKNASPSIILLDDLDKFGNGEQFAQEYTSVQGLMDDYRDYDIFIVATVNNLYKLPDSLRRVGRFDRVINIENPTNNDSKGITNYYFLDKNIDPSVNMNTVSSMLLGYSCATLESVINMAGLYAVYEREPTIKMRHIVNAIFNTVYDMNTIDKMDLSPYELEMLSYHEAGHAAASQLLSPGTIAFSTLRTRKYDEPGCGEVRDTNISDAYQSFIKVMIMVAGKAAIDIKYNGMPDKYSSEELKEAIDILNNLSKDLGLDGMKNITSWEGSYDAKSKVSENTTDRFEKLYEYIKQKLYINWSFVEEIHNELLRKETLVLDDLVEIQNRIMSPYQSLLPTIESSYRVIQ